MFIPNFVKSWCISALFFIACSPAFALNSNILSLANKQTWSLLVHNVGAHAQITDPKFLLSKNEFSAHRELELTLEAFKTNPKDAFCRFPARISFLSKELNLDLPEDRFSNCPELKSFLDHVPFDSLELVYASEVLSSATSMMGHIFIKAKGVNSNNIPVAHSLAYYTEIKTINPVELIIESTITGMPGFFNVRPFSKDVEQYIENEQRNLWQFSLRASPDQLHLLQLHIWELRQVNITYYFQSFNCATLTLELLALLQPTVLNHKSMIVSPTDVVKAALAEDIVHETALDTSPHWLHHALRDAITQKDADKIDDLLFATNSISTEEKNRQLTEMATDPIIARYIALSADNAGINTTVSDFYKQGLSNHVLFDFTNYKHPAKTPQDSALGVSWTQDNEGNKILLHYLAAGHLLHNDNRQYLSESELAIAKATISIIPSTKKFQFDELTIYSARSLSPDHQAFPVLSGEFYLGYRQSYKQELRVDSAFEISGAAGKSFKFHKDIVGFAIAGGGLTTVAGESKAFIYAKTGAVLNLIADTKLYLQYEMNSGKIHQSKRFDETEVILSWFPEMNQTVSFRTNFANDKKSHQSRLNLEYYYHF